MVMAKSGYSTETVDPEFQDLEERFKLLDASARKLSEDAKKFKDALSSMLTHQEIFAGTLLEVYQPITAYSGSSPASADGSGDAAAPRRSSIKQYKETDRTSLQAAQEFSAFAQTSREFLLPDLDTLERRLVAPAADLVVMLDNVKRVMVKRSHKLLDYDRHREAVKKLKEKERTVSDEKALGKAEQAFDQANREYTHINNLLKQELPLLLLLKAPFIDPCFQTLYWYQLKVHQSLHQSYQSLLQQPAFDTSVSAAVGFESKVERQAALLDDITLMSKNRKPSTSTNPLSPDYVPPGSVVGGSGGGPSGVDRTVDSQSPPPAYIPTSVPAQFTSATSASSFKQMHNNAAPYGAAPIVSPFGANLPPPPPPSGGSGTTFVTALYDYQAQADGDLSFQRDDRIEVIERTADPNDWWTGRLRGQTGIFPGNGAEKAHPYSRKAGQMRRAFAREERVDKLKTMKDVERTREVDRMVWFKYALPDDVPAATPEMVHDLIDQLSLTFLSALPKYIHRNDDEIEQLKAQVRPNRPKPAKLALYDMLMGKDRHEYRTGMKVPNMTDPINVARLRLWEGDYNGITAIKMTSVVAANKPEDVVEEKEMAEAKDDDAEEGDEAEEQ
ncbi:UNVERIFIED_CONTAM: hypothetical protein HDU68_006013 [Siphonaria sp. JEL0065]|nr:hypothetical protein HDU68_006013 [Siphonaria sp. JEL0065]